MLVIILQTCECARHNFKLLDHLHLLQSFVPENVSLLFPYFLSHMLTNIMDQVMWTFSLYLEAVAILPQLILLQRTRNIDNLTGQYVFLLGYDNSLTTLIEQ